MKDWICENCGEVLSHEFDTCWNCGKQQKEEEFGETQPLALEPDFDDQQKVFAEEPEPREEIPAKVEVGEASEELFEQHSLWPLVIAALAVLVVLWSYGQN